MFKIRFVIFCIFLSIYGLGNISTTKSQIQSFNIGGVLIKIPVPDSTLVEVGSSNRESMNIFVPQNNRLICGFVLSEDLPKLFKSSKQDIMVKYALVEVPRRGENMDCGVNDFNEVISGADESLNTSSFTTETENEFNNRMKSLNLNDMQVSLGQPVQLGRFFYKQNLFCMGMLMKVEMSGTTTKYGAAIMLIRVKKRLLFVYLYNEYKNEESVEWLRKTSANWGEAILKANK